MVTGFITSALIIYLSFKRHLERDHASSGTETMKALGKQEPVPQPGCGTVAMPQQGVLVGMGGCCSSSLSPAGDQAKGSCQLGLGDQPSPKGSVIGFTSLQQEPSTTCHSCQGIFGTGMWVENPQECQSHGQSPKREQCLTGENMLWKIDLILVWKQH